MTTSSPYQSSSNSAKADDVLNTVPYAPSEVSPHSPSNIELFPMYMAYEGKNQQTLQILSQTLKLKESFQKLEVGAEALESEFIETMKNYSGNFTWGLDPKASGLIDGFLSNYRPNNYKQSGDKRKDKHSSTSSAMSPISFKNSSCARSSFQDPSHVKLRKSTNVFTVSKDESTDFSDYQSDMRQKKALPATPAYFYGITLKTSRALSDKRSRGRPPRRQHSSHLPHAVSNSPSFSPNRGPGRPPKNHRVPIINNYHSTELWNAPISAKSAGICLGSKWPSSLPLNHTISPSDAIEKNMKQNGNLISLPPNQSHCDNAASALLDEKETKSSDSTIIEKPNQKKKKNCTS